MQAGNLLWYDLHQMLPTKAVEKNLRKGWREAVRLTEHTLPAMPFPEGHGGWLPGRIRP